MAHNYDRTAAIGPTPANRAAQTMGWTVKLVDRAQKALYSEDPSKGLDFMATALSHFSSALMELDLNPDKASALAAQLRSESRSFR